MVDNHLKNDFNAESEHYAPISALNDLAFCKRRCAYHRLENIWVDSSHTVHGTFLHRKVHSNGRKSSNCNEAVRSLKVISHVLKLQGVCDLVEFSQNMETTVPYPVEYKRGKKKSWINDDIQLCAQALCLEEMLKINIPKGAIYHISSKSRRVVIFDEDLRTKTILSANEINQLLKQKSLPEPILLPHCKKCSLKNHCLPDIHAKNKSFLAELGNLFVP